MCYDAGMIATAIKIALHTLRVILALLSPVDYQDLRVAKIRANAHNLPDVQPELIDSAVDAAFATETLAVPAELLLSIAWGESRFRPDQRTGVVCGALQVNPDDIGEPRGNCVRWANDMHLGFAAGVRELEMMLADRRVRGNLRLALLYRACGNAAFDGTCTKGQWPGWVLMRAAMILGPHSESQTPRPGS